MEKGEAELRAQPIGELGGDERGRAWQSSATAMALAAAAMAALRRRRSQKRKWERRAV